MAVEIPVVVDIESAFATAAKDVKTAMRPLSQSLNELYDKLADWQEKLKSTKSGDAFLVAAKAVQSLREQIAMTEYTLEQLSTNTGSIHQMSSAVQELERRWAELKKEQIYNADGSLTKEAIEAQKAYANLQMELDKVRGLLTEEYQSQRKASEEAKKYAEEKKRANQQMQMENATLRQQATTIKQLQQQEQILTKRLSESTIGSAEYKNYAAQLQQVKTRLAEVRKELDGTTASQKANASAITQAKTATDAQNASLKKQSAILSQLKSLAGMYISVFGGIRFIKNIRDVTAELELQKVALGSILRDTELANSLFAQIKTAALKSPFEIKDLVTYTKQLAAYRVENEKLFDVTMQLADVSAGLGVDMNRLILAYGQVRAASVLRGQELRQFTEAGIPLVEKLAEKFNELGRKGTNTADVFELISKRAVPFSMIESIFEDMTSAGGEFYNMQEKQSETLKGKWMKLKDAVTIMYDEIGNTSGVHSAMNDLIDFALKLARSWRDVATVVKTVAGAMIAYSVTTKSVAAATISMTKAEAIDLALKKKKAIIMPKLISWAFSDAAAKRLNTKATRLLTHAQVRLAMANTAVGRSFWKAAVAMMSNPYAAALAGAVALVGGLALVISKATRAKFTVEEFEKTIADYTSASKKAAEMQKLADQYEELSEKADKDEKEQAKLVRISRELGKAFPEAVEGINAENNALDINIKKVRDLTEAQKNLVRASVEYDKQQAEKQLKKLQKRLGNLTGIDISEEADKAVYVGAKITDVSEKARAKIGKKVIELNEQIQKLVDTIKSAEDALDEIDGKEKKGDETGSELVSWKQKIVDLQKEKLKVAETPLFDDEEIKGFDSVLDFSKKLKKKLDEINADIKANKELVKSATDETREKIEKDIEVGEEYKGLIEALTVALGIVFKSSGSGRDTRLSDLKNDISEVTNAYKKYLELVKYMSKEKALIEIDSLFPQLKGWEPTFDNTVAKLREKLEEVKKKLKINPKDKVLLDMQRALETEISNLRFDDLKKDIDEKLKRLQEDIKRSEAARNLFNDMLGLTGDNELAMSLTMQVYGQVGDEFKDRVQKEMLASLESAKDIMGPDIFSDMTKKVELFDTDKIREQINDLPEAIRPAFVKLLDENDKYNSEIVKSYSKLLLKFDEIEQQRVDIKQKAAQEIKTIEEGLALEIAGIDKNSTIEDKEAAKARARARAQSVTDAIVREQNVQLSRLEKDYRLFFSSIGTISEEAARKVAANQKRMLTEQFEKHEISYSQYVREIARVNEQLDKYEKNTSMFRTYLSGGVDAVAEKYRDMANSIRAISNTIEIKQDAGGIFEIDETSREYIDKIGSIMGGKVFNVEGVKGRKNVASQLVEAVSKMSSDVEDFKENLISALDIAADKADSFSSAFASGLSTAGFWVTNVSTLIKELDAFNEENMETPKWLDTLASTVTWTLGVAGDEAWDRLANLNEYATSGFEKLSQGNIIGAIADNVKGLIDFWGPNIKKIDREIKAQKEILDDLEYSYKRLDKVISESFGAEYIYNYNEQLKNLEAQQEAYLKQAEAERSKGKKADKDAIKSYEDAARDAADKIADMQAQLSEFFAGTDLASAAEEFANSWIDAYKEFGSTTDAMSEKFREMIQNMINRSLAAKIMQEMLSPIFDQIDTMARDGLLSTEEIASIAALAQNQIPLINDAMTNLMSSLAAAGYDVRNSTAGLTGISKSIAGASEESILGLAAGINTQNYYMSYMPTISENVAQILTYLTGGTATPEMNGGEEVGEQMPSVQRMIYEHLPRIDENLDALLRAFKSVIVPKNGQNRVAVS